MLSVRMHPSPLIRLTRFDPTPVTSKSGSTDTHTLAPLHYYVPKRMPNFPVVDAWMLHPSRKEEKSLVCFEVTKQKRHPPTVESVKKWLQMHEECHGSPLSALSVVHLVYVVPSPKDVFGYQEIKKYPPRKEDNQPKKSIPPKEDGTQGAIDPVKFWKGVKQYCLCLNPDTPSRGC